MRAAYHARGRRISRSGVVSTITRHSAEKLALKKGDQVLAINKATEVLIAK